VAREESGDVVHEHGIRQGLLFFVRGEEGGSLGEGRGTSTGSKGMGGSARDEGEPVGTRGNERVRE
jgi:hypothetical protein